MPDIRIWTARAHRLLSPVLAEIGALHRRGESCILLVPEQFTLGAERELFARLGMNAFFTLQVLSPSRLSDLVLAQAGSDGRAPLDAAGRLMAVSRALERCEDQLAYYRSSAHRRGFAEKLNALMTDMKRGGLTPESLSAYASTLESGEKLRDIAILYAAYEQIIGKGFADGEDRLRYVASRLFKSGLMENQNVFVYGFDALPEQLTQLLLSMAPLCRELTVALVCDGESAPDGELYLPVRQGIGRFTARLAELGLSVRQEPQPPKELPAAPALRHLDKALYVHPPKPFEEPQTSVYVSVYQSPFEEATAAARQIMGLCQSGMEIERIAVLYPDQNGYAFAVAAALRDSGLPFYTDQKLPATSHGLVRYLLCALRAMADGYQNESMLGMLKSGYSSLAFEEACMLENYAISYGVNRSRWAKPFAKGPSPEHTAACEALRLRLMAPLLKARQELVAARDTHASLSAVFGLLTDVGAYEALQAEEEALLQNGLQVRAHQNSQVWSALLQMLDQLYALSDGARVPLRHIANRLECGFSAVSLAALPPASHMLHAGLLGHYLAEEMDAVFLLGLSDGVLARETASLLSEEERARTERDTGAFLGLTDESRVLLARLDLKRAMTLPTQFLFVSYAKTSPDGTALRPLSLAVTLRDRLLKDPPHIQPEALPISSPQALQELSLRLRAFSDGTGETNPLPDYWKQLLGKLLHSQATGEKTMRLLQAANHRLGSGSLPPAEAAALFGDETLSVSRLEQFASCPFKHFVEYGLRPQIVKEWKVEPIDTGNFYHASLHNFAGLAKARQAYPNIPPEEVEALADEAIAPLLAELMQGPMGDGARSQAIFERARSTVRTAALTVTRHLAAGRFRLSETEATFGYPGGMPPIVLALPNGKEVMLRGKIDRIDRYETGDSVYLRVIDYKSSRQDLDATRTWWGLQLQLLLYLDACVCAQAGALPAGAFYFYVADPRVESETDVKALVEDELRQLLQLRGIALADVEILSAMDEGDLPVALPAMLDKSGQVKSAAKALDMPQFKALLAHAREVATALSAGIFSGDTALRPVEDGGKTACDHCDFSDICGFDPAAEGAAFQTLPAMDIKALRDHLSPAGGLEP